MDKLTKEQAIIIEGYTGICCGVLSETHEEIEKRLGRPVFTHEFPMLREEIKEAFKEDFVSICFNKKKNNSVE